MKIFSFIASRKEKNSNTLRVVEQLVQEIKLKVKEKNIEYEFFMPQDLELTSCKGCENCFRNGFCPMDKMDKFDIIKKKMLDADIIILGTPVYSATVSGDMKTFIDRVSYWLHILPLAGKLGIITITASSNSVMETNTYLKRIMESWGLFIPCSVLCTVDAPKMIDDPSFKEVAIPQYANKVVEYLNGDKKVESTKYHEKYFNYLKQGYDIPGDFKDAELIYWRKNGLLNCTTYQDLLEKLQK